MSQCKTRLVETGDTVLYNGCKCVIHYIVDHHNKQLFSEKLCNVCRLIIFDGIFEKNVCINEVSI